MFFVIYTLSSRFITNFKIIIQYGILHNFNTLGSLYLDPLSGIFLLSLISFISELLISKFRSARSSLRLLASAYANFRTNPKAVRNSSN